MIMLAKIADFQVTHISVGSTFVCVCQFSFNFCSLCCLNIERLNNVRVNAMCNCSGDGMRSRDQLGWDENLIAFAVKKPNRRGTYNLYSSPTDGISSFGIFFLNVVVALDSLNLIFLAQIEPNVDRQLPKFNTSHRTP